MKWKDATGYSRGETPETREPSCFKIGDTWVELSVLTGHMYDPDSWVVHLRARNLDTHSIGPKSMTREQARAKAIKLLKDWRSHVNAAVDAIIEAGEIPDKPDRV